MKLLVITHVNHTQKDNKFYGYAPYTREMNLWFRHVDEVTVIAPVRKRDLSAIDEPYSHSNLNVKNIPAIQFTSIGKSLVSFFKIPSIVWTIYRACKSADHIHLRCPGNVGLLGCFVQVLFPKTNKSAKYAGNWDPV